MKLLKGCSCSHKADHVLYVGKLAFRGYACGVGVVTWIEIFSLEQSLNGLVSLDDNEC
jgi:hypothetical protein